MFEDNVAPFPAGDDPEMGDSDVVDSEIARSEDRESESGGGEMSAEDQLGEIVRQYSALVRSAILRTGGNAGAHEADEIEQRVWLALWKQIQREQKIHYPTSYVYRAAVRETVRYLRSERRIDEKAAAALEGVDPTALQIGPERNLESTELGEQIREELSQLHEPRRLAVQAHLMGHSATEIMEMYGWTYQKARNSIARGMADLRRGLSERGLDRDFRPSD